MKVQQYLEQLYNNRLMQHNDQFQAFEHALLKIQEHGDCSSIGELCMVFDDRTEHHEVMWGLIHLIESYQEQEALTHLVHAMPQMMQRAEEWLEILNYRMLNHDKTRKRYGQVLANAQSDVREVLVPLLRRIGDENPQKFAASVAEVLGA